MMDEGYFAGLPAQASHNGLLRLTPTSPHDQEHHPFSFQSTSTFALHNDGHPPFIFEVQGDTKHQRGETSSNALASSTPLFVSGDIDEDEDDDDDARFDSLGLPKRKRALQRLSLTSSIASSIPSTAPSETDPLDYNECEAGAAENQATAFDDATVGRSAARLPDLVHSRSNSTMREVPTAATVFTAFNLSDFISDGAANDGDTAPASATTAASSSSQRIVDDAHSQNLTLTRSSFTTPQRPGLHRDWSSLSASTACSEDAAERLGIPASPYSPSRLSNSSSSSLSASHSAALDLATNSTANMQLSSPLSRNNASLAPPPSDHHHPGHAVHAHLRASDGLGLSPQGGVGSSGDMSRSMSTPQLDLSNPSGSSMAACNPAHIVPGSLTQHQNVGNSSSPSLQSYYPSISNSGSAVGSPLRLEYNDIVYYPNSTPATPGSPFNDHEQRLWSAAPCESGAPDMLRDDMGQPMMLSYSAPAHKTTFMQRDCDSSPSSPLVPGHPVRFSRPTAHLASQQSSPYHGPHFAPPQGMMHSQTPSLVGSLQGLAAPSLYTGIITKRSRGRRVPNNPEEVNNLGKSGKIYTCKVPGCGKCFKRSEHLKRHVRSIHTDEKPYMCPFPNCFKRFSRHDNLNQHARVHAGTAPGEAGSSANSSMAGSVSPTCSPLSLSVSFPSRRPSTQSASGLRHEEAAYGCEDVFTFEADEAEQQPEDSDYDVQHLNLA